MNHWQKLPQFKVWWLFKAEFSTGLSVGSEDSPQESFGPVERLLDPWRILPEALSQAVHCTFEVNSVKHIVTVLLFSYELPKTENHQPFTG